MKLASQTLIETMRQRPVNGDSSFDFTLATSGPPSWFAGRPTEALPFPLDPVLEVGGGGHIIVVLAPGEPIAEGRPQGRVSEDQIGTGDLAEPKVGQLRLRQSTGILPHNGQRLFAEQG